MSEMRLETLTMPTAPVGAENPLPPLFSRADIHQEPSTGQEHPGELDEEMRRNMSYGRVPSALPYLIQDGYGRDRSPAPHQVAVLESDRMRATFLLNAGGRLWSLVDLASGRELLHRNPMFQPANLALRNAWFAGGVEWNIGTTGHAPTTCEPLHAGRVELPDGTPMLRMYEFERIREVVFQVDAWLPDGSPVLLVHVRITNPGDAEVPMYWWSNIAVPQAEGVRVLAPADSAWQFGYDRRMRRVPVPVHDGLDRTYPARAGEAADYFFAIDDDQRRWVAALDEHGAGLFQTSTQVLRGRKLFVWGTNAGGKHWQDWLSGSTGEYFEIQAGLARTQLEHLPMPAHTAWSWVEALGPLKADPDAVHSDDWRVARDAVTAAIDRLVPEPVVDAALALATDSADSPPVERLHTGSGWGALERRLRGRAGDTSLDLPGTPFPDSSLDAAQQPWLELLDDGRMTSPDAATPPTSYQVSRRWTATLEAATDSWVAALHLGVVRAYHGDLGGTREAWTRSLTIKPTAWAGRNLAGLAAATDDRPGAVTAYRRALALRPDLAPLRLELVTTLLADRNGAGALEVIEAAPPEHRALGRFRWAEAKAALLTGQLDRAGSIIAGGIVVPDVREGEVALDELWVDYQAALQAAALGRPVTEDLRAYVRATMPVPPALDFRMSTPGADLGEQAG
jgi:hypothetical protein